jgi:nicotinamidase/pyrazinamidase
LKNALLLVDVQKDFCPGGALPASNGNKIIPVINQLMDQFDYVIASKDWHPQKSIHFEKWPVHCVKNTEGAEFPTELQFEKINQVFLKGTANMDDGYNAFDATNISLMEWLKKHQVDTLYLCGIATEYCVNETAKGALRNGFKTYIITDAIAEIDSQPGDGKKALQALKEKGAHLLTSEKIGKLIS